MEIKNAQGSTIGYPSNSWASCTYLGHAKNLVDNDDENVCCICRKGSN